MARRAITPRVRALKVEGGFVYFSDEKRVAYNVKGVTGRTHGYPAITPTHVRLAKAFLESQGVLSTGH